MTSPLMWNCLCSVREESEHSKRTLGGLSATKREGFRKGEGGKRIETGGLVDGEGGVGRT